MSQFPPRTRHESSQSRNPNLKLRTRPEDHYGSPYYQGQDAQYDDSENPVYSDDYQEVQKIKRLSFWSNKDPEPDEDGDWGERQSPSTFILAIVILVVACTLTWFLFQWLSGGHTGAPPVIQADTSPFKVRPDHPGGMMIPHQDKLVYGRLSPDTSPPVERLLPPPEQVMPEPPPPYPDGRQPQYYGPPPPGYSPAWPQGSAGYPPHGQGYPPHPTAQPAPYPPMTPPPYPQGSQQPMMPPSGPPNPDYPYGVPPQSQQPYAPPHPYSGQSPYGDAAIPQDTPPRREETDRGTKPYQKKGVSAVDPVRPASEEEDDEEMNSQEGSLELSDLIARESKASAVRSPRSGADRSFKLTPLDPGLPKIQIASLPSRAMAEQEMRRLRGNYGHLFGNRPWNIQKINLGGNRGVTHRLVVGSFKNRENAVKFCSKLRAEGVGCMVVAPARE